MATGERKAINRKAVAMITALQLALYYVIFYTIPAVNPTVGTKVLLGLISLFSGILFALFITQSDVKMEKYRSKGRISAILAVSLYASLASFAQRFFFEGYSRMHFSLSGFICCGLALLWFVPVIYSLIRIMEMLSPEGEREKGDGRKFYFIVFAVYSLWMMIVLMAFRPGGFPPDSVSQLFQAIGFDRIYNAHPALHTLYFRLVLKLTGNRAMFITAGQMLAFAALTAGFVSMFSSWGCRRWVAALGGMVFLMLPANVLNSVSAVKDFPYSLSLLWATLCLCKIARNIEDGCRFSNLAQLSVATFFIYGFRHNGLVPMIFIVILCMVLTVKFFGRIKFRLLLTGLAAVAMIIIYKGPVFAIFDVYPSTQSPYTTMLCALGSCVNQGLPLSDETVETLESIMPLEDWGKYYSRYEGHDQYYWGRGEDAVYETDHVTAKMAFSAYLEALFKYPDVIIKDRLDGMDILWDVHNPTDSFNEKSYDTIYFMPYSEVFFNTENMEEKGYYQFARPSKLADAYRETKNVSIYSASDMLNWRTGAYIIFMLAVLIYIAANGKKRLLWAAVPMAGNVFSLVFMLYHQSFRYVYAQQPMILALAAAALFISAGESKKEIAKI